MESSQSKRFCDKTFVTDGNVNGSKNVKYHDVTIMGLWGIEGVLGIMGY
ncbi:hypothetical protein BVRB_7g162710 [Beta vulgaris subsp. vulgaris]|nr:hypothetical protein BVRB_7g162710 [Beta vulgaris subsp. vulgaris]